jgi:hypothetical protein
LTPFLLGDFCLFVSQPQHDGEVRPALLLTCEPCTLSTFPVPLSAAGSLSGVPWHLSLKLWGHFTGRAPRSGRMPMESQVDLLDVRVGRYPQVTMFLSLLDR